MSMNTRIDTETIERISGVNTRKCMKCGKCSATCPAFDEMDYHPHQFVAMVEKGDIEPLMKSKSIWNCQTGGRNPPGRNPPARPKPLKSRTNPGTPRRRTAPTGNRQRLP